MSLSARQKVVPTAAKVSSSGAKNLTFNINEYVKEGVDAAKVQEVYEAFRLFDTDGQGSIDLKGTTLQTQSSRVLWFPSGLTPETRQSLI